MSSLSLSSLSSLPSSLPSLSGATKVLQDLETNSSTSDSATFCDNLADSISSSMGGTSGCLLEIFFRSMGTFFVTQENGNWPDALLSGLNAIKLYGGAQVGMRTMLDSLEPAIQALRSSDLATAVVAAKEGAERTKTLISLAGRSNYIDNDFLKDTPDPGAVSVSVAFLAAFEALSK